MNIPRERWVTMIVGGVFITVVGVLLVRGLFIVPAGNAQARIESLTEKIRLAEIEQNSRRKKVSHLIDMAAKTLGKDEMRVAEDLRVILTGLLHRSGLGSDRFSLKPMSGQRVAKAYTEAGWVVSARGTAKEVAAFCHLLSEQPFLLKVNDLTLTPVPRSDQLKIQARCSTIVVKLPAKRKMPATISRVGSEAVKIEPAQQQHLAALVGRDMFLPYIAQPVVVTPPQPDPPVADEESTTTEPPGPPPTQFVIVGLPSWQGEPDVMVKDTQSGEIQAYHPGDALAGGKIAMVDYRAMPRQDDPELMCHSRVIIKIGPEYWAIDLGQTLADKRKLNTDDLPEMLRTEASHHDDAHRDEVASPAT